MSLPPDSQLVSQQEGVKRAMANIKLDPKCHGVMRIPLNIDLQSTTSEPIDCQYVKCDNQWCVDVCLDSVTLPKVVRQQQQQSGQTTEMPIAMYDLNNLPSIRSWEAVCQSLVSQKPASRIYQQGSSCTLMDMIEDGHTLQSFLDAGVTPDDLVQHGACYRYQEVLAVMNEKGYLASAPFLRLPLAQYVAPCLLTDHLSIIQDSDSVTPFLVWTPYHLSEADWITQPIRDYSRTLIHHLNQIFFLLVRVAELSTAVLKIDVPEVSVPVAIFQAFPKAVLAGATDDKSCFKAIANEIMKIPHDLHRIESAEPYVHELLSGLAALHDYLEHHQLKSHPNIRALYKTAPEPGIFKGLFDRFPDSDAPEEKRWFQALEKQNASFSRQQQAMKQQSVSFHQTVKQQQQAVKPQQVMSFQQAVQQQQATKQQAMSFQQAVQQQQASKPQQAMYLPQAQRQQQTVKQIQPITHIPTSGQAISQSISQAPQSAELSMNADMKAAIQQRMSRRQSQTSASQLQSLPVAGAGPGNSQRRPALPSWYSYY